MTLEAAPFYEDVARAPAGGEAYWLRCADGVRIRVAAWTKGERGTVLLFPGRTEYIEKYGSAAGDLTERGFATIIVDWRGQGLADRALDDRATGHVSTFIDYQHDVTAVVEAARKLGMPEPYYMIGHSMGGCIGLRAILNGLDVKSALFSAPMWGIRIAAALRPIALAIAATSKRVGQSHRYVPTTGPVTYVRAAQFEGNTLTSDREMFDFMRHQLTTHPDLELGGPSLHWLHEALHEIRELHAAPAPTIPMITMLGSRERIVDTGAVRRLVAGWPTNRLDVIEGAEHEIMMEGPAVRQRIFDTAAQLFVTGRIDAAAAE